jgi:hypothetical protein
MLSDFLFKEYEMCFEQLRFYDTRQDELLKYMFTLTSAAAAAQFAVLQFLGKPSAIFFGAQGLFCLVVFIATLLMYLMMLQNRLYFVFVTRQLNAVRKHLLETNAPAFVDNRMWLASDFPAFKWGSIHTFQMVGAVVISALFAAAAVFGCLRAASCGCASAAAAIIFIFVGISEALGGALLLQRKGAQTADVATHGK